MPAALPSALRSPHLAPRAESAALALRLLADGKPAWQDLAGVAARDAAFAHALLAAAPLSRREGAEELPQLLARRLEDLGGDLLRAWLLHREASASHTAMREEILSHSLITAECARQISIALAYPRPQEAYLAGLWHDLGRLWLLVAAPDYAEWAAGFDSEATLAPEERKRYGHDHAPLAGRLAAECGAPFPVADAIVLHHGLEEQAATAHPLTRYLWAAEILAGPKHPALLDAASRVTGLEVSALLDLRASAARLCSAIPPQAGAGRNESDLLEILADPGRPSIPSSSLVPTSRVPTLPAPDDYWRHVALRGLLQGSFNDAATEVVGRRLDMACRLLFGCPRPFLASVEPGGQLLAVPVPDGDEIGQLFNELHMSLDDDTSVVALAARTGTPTSQFPEASNPGRSPRDWQLARWLQTPGLLCLPCGSNREPCVAVFGIEEPGASPASTQSLMAILAASAATAVLEQARRSAAEAALKASLEQRYREHARRVVHEVNNPLTVIRTYLEMIGQRGDADDTLREEMTILNKELDRVGNLLKGVTQAPVDKPEAARSNVADILQELRALYGEPLFARRNLELDLRTLPGLPAARIPPSVLKQVLLNLFRNASEALLDGGKLSVSTPGTLIADGVPCVEIRLIDNGPGIPAERLVQLFEAKPSTKPGHQGVGLSICRDLLASWQASIVYRSQMGAGTSIQIFIPLD